MQEFHRSHEWFHPPRTPRGYESRLQRSECATGPAHPGRRFALPWADMNDAFGVRFTVPMSFPLQGINLRLVECGDRLLGRGLVGAATGAAVTVRSPRDEAQREHKYSWISPVGRTSSNRSRTGCEVLHFGQYSSLAVKFPNCCSISFKMANSRREFKFHRQITSEKLHDVNREGAESIQQL